MSDDIAGAEPSLRSVRLFGVDVSVEDYEATTNWLLRCAREQRNVIVEHLAVHNLVSAVRDPHFLRTLQDYDVVTADGQPICFAIRLLHGVRLDDRVTARELMLKLCATAAWRGLPIYLYGDEEGTVQRLRERLLARFPRLQIAGCEGSVFRALTSDEDAALVQRINASGAAFVFIALGCPFQEFFVRAHRDRVRAIQLCVGSAFKGLAGDRRIAPRWVQRTSLEWLFRLAQDPVRLGKRYLVSNTLFIALLWRAWWRQRLGALASRSRPRNA